MKNIFTDGYSAHPPQKDFRELFYASGFSGYFLCHVEVHRHGLFLKKTNHKFVQEFAMLISFILQKRNITKEQVQWAKNNAVDLKKRWIPLG